MEGLFQVNLGHVLSTLNEIEGVCFRPHCGRLEIMAEGGV